jgi:hypothetical protein
MIHPLPSRLLPATHRIACSDFSLVQPCLLLPGGPRLQSISSACHCVQPSPGTRHVPTVLSLLSPPGLLYLPCPLPCLCTLPPCDPCPLVAKCGHAQSSCQRQRLRQSQFPVTLLPICARRRSVRLAQCQCHHTRCCTSTRTHTSTLALLQLRLSILCVAESRQGDREARRCVGVDCESAALLAIVCLGDKCG